MRILSHLPLILAAGVSMAAAWWFSGWEGLQLSVLGLSLLLTFAMASRTRRAERALERSESRFLEALSEGKTAERRLQAAEDHLRQSQKMEAVGRLAGGIAHDFNNLLTAINGYAELALTRMPQADPNRAMLEEVRKAGDRAATITRQLLTFSRKQLISPIAMDLNAMVRDLERMLGRMLGSQVRMDVELAEDLAAIKADPGQVGQVILNLALNGKDAMGEGGRLTLTTANVRVAGDEPGWYLKPAPGEYVCLAVADTGKGMDAEVKEHLFEPFFSTKPGARGTGLGLPTVYGILDQARGGIRMTSDEPGTAGGSGTVFYAYFPKAAQQDWEMRPDAEAPVPERRREETVLVVEDEENVRHLVGSVLGSKGYQVLEASGAREAMYIHENHPGPIHYLLTDVIMPGRSGRELARDLQRARPGIRTIFMSGYTDDVLLQQGLEASKALFLGKPFTPKDLLRKFAEAEDRVAAPAPRPG
jgi:signal transduction histidine kinase/ActR/RegA family two-component response regulator